MLIDVETFNQYTGVFGDTLAESYLQAAQEIVSNYLGYDIEKSDREASFDGSGYFEQSVNARPINEIYSITEDGRETDLSDIYTAANYLIKKSKNDFSEGLDNIHVSFNAGWTSENLPEIIRGTILQIASMRQIESSQNIGVSSKTFGESGTRVFQNTKNYDPYLINVSKYKVL